MLIIYPLIILTQFLPIILPQAITSPIQSSLHDFNQNLDLNAFFHYHHKSQHQYPFKCSSKDGPNCNFINDKFFGESIIRKDSKLQEQILQEMHYQLNAYDNWAEIHNNNEQIYLTASSLKEQYFEEQESRKKKNQGRIQNILITFNDLKISSVSESLNNYEYKITQLSKSFKQKSEKNKIKNQDEISENVKISFKNIYTPKKKYNLLNRYQIKFLSQIYSNWLSKYHKSSELDESFSTKKPNENYVYTLDQEGLVYFSNPVKFYHLFIRFHDFGEIQNEENLLSEVKFYLGNKLISIINIQQPNIYFYNKWFKIELQNGKLIDRIVLNSNLDIDNIYIQTEYYQELSSTLQKEPELKAFQKGEKFEQLEELEKEITDTIKQKFEEMDIDIKVMTLGNQDDIDDIKGNLKTQTKKNKAKLKKNSDKYNLIEQEMLNLETVTLNQNILTMSDNEFKGLITKFIALKKEVIEVNDPRILQQYEDIMLALKEIEKIREFGTIDPESAGMKELNELEEKLQNAQIDFTKFPGFIEENCMDYYQLYLSLENQQEVLKLNDEVELSEADEEEIKNIFKEYFGYELGEDELDYAVQQLDIKRSSKKKGKKSKKTN